MSTFTESVVEEAALPGWKPPAGGRPTPRPLGGVLASADGAQAGWQHEHTNT